MLPLVLLLPQQFVKLVFEAHVPTGIPVLSDGLLVVLSLLEVKIESPRNPIEIEVAIPQSLHPNSIRMPHKIKPDTSLLVDVNLTSLVEKINLCLVEIEDDLSTNDQHISSKPRIFPLT